MMTLRHVLGSGLTALAITVGASGVAAQNDPQQPRPAYDPYQQQQTQQPSTSFGNGYAVEDPARAQDEEPPKVAVLRGLEKVTARVSQFEVPVGQPVRFGRLEITVRRCHTRPPEETPETTAYLDIIDNQLDGTRAQAFSGWMFASSPALNPLQHPVYDVWVMTCRTLAPDEGDSSLPNSAGTP